MWACVLVKILKLWTSLDSECVCSHHHVSFQPAPQPCQTKVTKNKGNSEPPLLDGSGGMFWSSKFQMKYINLLESVFHPCFPGKQCWVHWFNTKSIEALAMSSSKRYISWAHSPLPIWATQSPWWVTSQSSLPQKAHEATIAKANFGVAYRFPGIQIWNLK